MADDTIDSGVVLRTIPGRLRSRFMVFALG